MRVAKHEKEIRANTTLATYLTIEGALAAVVKIGNPPPKEQGVSLTLSEEEIDAWLGSIAKVPFLEAVKAIHSNQQDPHATAAELLQLMENQPPEFSLTEMADYIQKAARYLERVAASIKKKGKVVEPASPLSKDKGKDDAHLTLVT